LSNAFDSFFILIIFYILLFIRLFRGGILSRGPLLRFLSALLSLLSRSLRLRLSASLIVLWQVYLINQFPNPLLNISTSNSIESLTIIVAQDASSNLTFGVDESYHLKVEAGIAFPGSCFPPIPV
jgi:hypothetical protein